MRGAIIGDIIGSAFIKDARLTTEFQLLKPISSFTDDTILTIATADSIINNQCFKITSKKWIEKYPYAGYNPDFMEWVQKDKPEQYRSNGDGVARRISSIGFFAETLDQAITLAETTTALTHNTPEMMKAAKAVATSTYLSKQGMKKESIKNYIQTNFGYDLNKDLSELKAAMLAEEIESLAPAAIIIFLISYSYEDAIRKAISLGCTRCNTIASIVGGISQAYYKHIPKSIIRKALDRITPEMATFIDNFEDKYVLYPHPAEALLGMH